jgi:hypothetical protein
MSHTDGYKATVTDFGCTLAQALQSLPCDSSPQDRKRSCQKISKVLAVARLSSLAGPLKLTAGILPQKRPASKNRAGTK